MGTAILATLSAFLLLDYSEITTFRKAILKPPKISVQNLLNLNRSGVCFSSLICY